MVSSNAIYKVNERIKKISIFLWKSDKTQLSHVAKEVERTQVYKLDIKHDDCNVEFRILQKDAKLNSKSQNEFLFYSSTICCCQTNKIWSLSLLSSFFFYLCFLSCVLSLSSFFASLLLLFAFFFFIYFTLFLSFSDIDKVDHTPINIPY